MRSLKRKTNKRKRSKKNKHFLIKRVSNVFKNRFFLIEIWQLLILSGISILLIFTYLNQSWTIISNEEIVVTGIYGITKNDVKKATQIFFPRNLLEISPKEIEYHLLEKLPIKAISVNRKIFPPGINLKIFERVPIAYASRISSNKIEHGMIDLEGYWIPLEFINQSEKNDTNISVENWTADKKDEITEIIKNRSRLKSPLKKIKLNSQHEISIETEYFNSVLLGSNIDHLIEQIEKLNQLQKSLPNLLINTKVKIVDLKDPNKPELITEDIPKK